MGSGASSPDEVRQALLELTAYFAAAARGNLDEAATYGPFRLLEGAQRVVRVMQQLDLSAVELDDWCDSVTTHAIALSTDNDRLASSADRLLAWLAERQRAAGAGSSESIGTGLDPGSS
jgi:hypothetical protein